MSSYLTAARLFSSNWKAAVNFGDSHANRLAALLNATENWQQRRDIWFLWSASEWLFYRSGRFEKMRRSWSMGMKTAILLNFQHFYSVKHQLENFVVFLIDGSIQIFWHSHFHHQESDQIPYLCTTINIWLVFKCDFSHIYMKKSQNFNVEILTWRPLHRIWNSIWEYSNRYTRT